jgi:acylphosphatase
MSESEESRNGGSGGDGDARLTARVSGDVQGVGFRMWARSRAEKLGVSGYATNLPDGRVEVVAEGPRAACTRLLEALRGSDAPGSVAGVSEAWTAAEGGTAGFEER